MSKNISTILAVLEGGSWEGGGGEGNGINARSAVHSPKLAQLSHFSRSAYITSLGTEIFSSKVCHLFSFIFSRVTN